MGSEGSDVMLMFDNPSLGPLISECVLLRRGSVRLVRVEVLSARGRRVEREGVL